SVHVLVPVLVRRPCMSRSTSTVRKVVGPDNFHLIYGRYAGLPRFDPRMTRTAVVLASEGQRHDDGPGSRRRWRHDHAGVVRGSATISWEMPISGARNGRRIRTRAIGNGVTFGNNSPHRMWMRILPPALRTTRRRYAGVNRNVPRSSRRVIPSQRCPG